jgi:hypothetical protein
MFREWRRNMKHVITFDEQPHIVFEWTRKWEGDDYLLPVFLLEYERLHKP